MIRFWLSAMLMSVTVLCGCKKPPEAAPAGAQKTIIIGFVGKSQSNPVFQAAASGARDAAAELSKKYNVKVQVEIVTPTAENAVRQSEAIDALTRRGVQGIAVSCSEARTLTPAIDRAVDKGIPVVCFDSDAAESKRFAYYGTNDAQCGAAVMQELAKSMGDKGTVAIIAGSEAAPNLQARAKGVRDELAKHPNMKLLDGGTFYHEETPERAAETVQQAQRAHPDINGWAFIGGWPLFTTDALKWPPGSVKVVSVDALPPQLPYLKSGHVDVLLAQDCYGWGTRSLELLMEKIINNKTPETPKVIDPLTRVTKDNADEYGKKWEKWLAK